MPRKLLLVVAAALVTAGCDSATTPSPPTPTRTAAPDEVRIVNLNAAMGYRNAAGDPAGTDATTADYELLAEDILDQRGDVANLQEMALPAARELRTILAARTGDEWELNFSYSSTATYFTGQEGETGPRPDYQDVPAGNAQLIRIGDGITGQQRLTGEQGVMLPSVGRSFVGAEIEVEGRTLEIYNTHLALADQVPDDVRARDVLALQETTERDTVPGPGEGHRVVVLTGDFNQDIEFVPGQPDPSPRTVDAIRAFMDTHGYADVGRDKGPTSDQKRPELGPSRIDYILARGIRTTDTVRFVSRESDHWGLATTIFWPGQGGASSYAPPPTPPPITESATGAPPPPTTSAPTTEAAITRYERYLRAIAQRNVPVICQIAGPAAKKAEDAGFGACEQNMPVTFSTLSPEQMDALMTATVDPARVTANGTTVAIPAAAVRGDVPFTATDLGDAVLSHLDGDWFVTGR